MDKLRMLKNLDCLAKTMRSIGLHPVTRLGRNIINSLISKKLTVEIDGLSLSGSMEHRGYLWSIREGTRESYMSALFKSVVKPAMVVCDVGSFIGYYSLIAAQRVGLSGKIYAFEPDQRNFSFLVKNIQMNNFSNLIIPVEKAVADKVGKRTLLLHRDDPGQNSLFFSDRRAVLKEVECISLDKFFEKKDRIDIIKIDVEGAENHVLKGMEELISRASGLLTMFVEYNPQALGASGIGAETLMNNLRGLGFAIMVIDEEKQCIKPIDGNIGSVKYVNLYCRSQKERLKK